MAVRISEACIRTYYQWSHCHLCHAACPSSAISFTSPLSVNVDLCNLCGRCADACPFDAVWGIKPVYKIRNFTLYEDNQPPPLPEKLLSLRDEGITQIKIKKTDSIWNESIDSINQILAANGHNGFIVNVSGEANEQISHTRRAFFRSIYSNMQGGSDSGGETEIAAAIAEYAFYQLKLEAELCYLCGACEKFCPKDCINIDTDKLTINNALCNGCNLCADACQRKAIKIIKKVNEPLISVYHVFLHSCPICHEAFASLNELTDPASACPACEFRSRWLIPIAKIG